MSHTLDVSDRRRAAPGRGPRGARGVLHVKRTAVAGTRDLSNFDRRGAAIKAHALTVQCTEHFIGLHFIDRELDVPQAWLASCKQLREPRPVLLSVDSSTAAGECLDDLHDMRLSVSMWLCTVAVLHIASAVQRSCAHLPSTAASSTASCSRTACHSPLTLPDM
jgi:hypothetical protein